MLHLFHKISSVAGLSFKTRWCLLWAQVVGKEAKIVTYDPKAVELPKVPAAPPLILSNDCREARWQTPRCVFVSVVDDTSSRV